MKTKAIKGIFTFITISLLGFLTGCSENDVLNDMQGAEADQASNVISGTASFDTGEVDAMFNTTPGTRTAVRYNSQKKLNYHWKKVIGFLYSCATSKVTKRRLSKKRCSLRLTIRYRSS